ncbi:MAG: hypothetical protein ACOCV2_03585 [Persicimonas sp.]
MAQTPRSDRAPAKSVDPTFAITLVLCALLAGGFGYWRMSSIPQVTEEDLTFDGDLDIDADRLERQYRETYGDIDLERVEEDWQALLDVGQRANEAQFEETSTSDRNELSVELKLLGHQVVPTTGYDGFVVSGEPLFEGCHEGLETLLKDIQSGDIDLETAREDPPKDAYDKYRKNCGNLLPHLLDRGLVTEEGEWGFEGAKTMVQILHRYRWAHIIYNEKRPRAQLTPYEVELMDRWRLELAEGLSEEDRRRSLERLDKGNADYEVDYARAILAYESGDYEEALEQFEKLAEEKPGKHYEAYADFVREKIEADSSTSSDADEAS